MKRGFIRYGVLGIGLLALTAAAFVVFSPSSFGDSGPLFKQAPLNPEFAKFMADRAAGRPWTTVTKDGHYLGEIPSPHDTSHLIPLRNPVPPDSLPATYDLRTKNKLTPIKNQGACGSCWAFATFGSLESYLKPGAIWDFSEQDLISKSGFDYGECDGGHMWMSAAYLVRWAGPLKESQNPYNYYYLDGAAPSKHVQNILMIDERKNATDNTKIKNAVMNNGAVMVSMWWSDSAYSSGNSSYYYNSSSQSNGGGHAVCVVGWDDNFSKSKFGHTPSGNGAFIVRNSWGTSWGKSGYFFVSYYDTFFGKRGGSAVVKGEPTSNYKTNYGYDDLGWVTSIGAVSPSPTCWMANIFTPSAAGSLKSVGFYAGANSNKYEIYVYTNVQAGKPRTGALKKKKTGSITTGWGYYTIPLGTNVALAKNQKFSIVVKMTTTGYNYPIPIEKKASGYSSKAKTASGQSYVSTDGTSWGELKSYVSTWCNVCLRGYAN